LLRCPTNERQDLLVGVDSTLEFSRHPDDWSKPSYGMKREKPVSKLILNRENETKYRLSCAPPNKWDYGWL